MAKLSLFEVPTGVKIKKIEVTPSTAQSALASSTSQTGYIQQSQAAFGVRTFTIDIVPTQRANAVDVEGFIHNLNAGAAYIFDWVNPSFRGQSVAGYYPPSLWSHGMPWQWASGTATISLTQPALKGDQTVFLSTDLWGAQLKAGSYIGFTDHYGLYMIRHFNQDGSAFLDTPLRADATGAVTLNPKIVLQALGTQSTSLETHYTEGGSIAMVERPHNEVMTYYELRSTRRIA